MQFSTWISMNIHNEFKDNLKSQNDFEVTEFFTKSEKWSDSLMYKDIWKNLQSFVSKLWSKLWWNHDQYLTDEEKMNYVIFWLEKNVAWMMNLFYCVKIFINLDNFITFLEQTYDDVSHEHTAMTKLENLWQRNQKFTSFFSEFLDLIDELDWNKLIKVAVLQQKISDKICEQLIETTLLKKLREFVIMCQWIDEDLWYNNFICSLRFMNSWLIILTTRSSAHAKINIL